MTTPAHARAKALFLAALSKPAADRRAFLAEACGTDVELRQDVESLLAHHVEEDGGARVDSPALTGGLTPHARSASAQTLLGHAMDAATAGSAGAEPSTRIVARAAARLEAVASVTFLASLILWIGVNAAQGELAAEFTAARQWAPPAAALIASAGVVLASRVGRWPATTLVRLGLVYEVIMSFAITGAVYLGAFDGVTATDLNLDRIGLSYVAPWLIFFSVLVPARPAEALAALIPSAAAMPVVYQAEALSGHAPALPLTQFLSLFVLPYALVVAFAFVASRLVHDLSVQVRRAQDLGSYRLDRRLGRGGMGEVWRATHRMLARPAAIKLIRADALPLEPAARAAAFARFEREAQAIAALRCPNTVELYDYGRAPDGTLFYVMELLEGVDLDAAVRRLGPFPASRVVQILVQVCRSLEEAHARGLVHRDIKPANVFLCRRGLDLDVVKVLDFGLVKTFAPAAGMPDARLTAAQTVAGTPDFMAPEMATTPGSVDPRADIYATGCVAYWLLTGRLVFECETPFATLVAHVRSPPTRPSAVTDAAIPADLEALVMACLVKEPASRPQSIGDVAKALAAIDPPHAWTRSEAEAWWQRLALEV